MLDTLAAVLAALGGNVQASLVDRAINAVLDANNEMLVRLDRIEAKIDVLKNKDAQDGLQYLRQALEPHRSLDEKKEQITLALRAFHSAASSSSDDPMGRSIARVYQAVCWKCLGKEKDTKLRLGEAVTDSCDAVYQTALKYNEPLRGASGAQRYLPGWGVTDERVRGRLLSGKDTSPVQRFIGSGPTRPARRLQTGMEPLLDQVNEWSIAVTGVYEDIQVPDYVTMRSLHVRNHLTRHCRIVSAPGKQGKAGRADVYVYLQPGATIDMRGIVISFIEAVPRDIDGTRYVDLHLSVDIAGYASRELKAYRDRSWTLEVGPIALRGYGNAAPQPRQGPGAREWLRNGRFRIGPDEVSGWHRIGRDEYASAPLTMALQPIAKSIVFPDPRPDIKVWLLPG
jgi:hypothetical protein